MICSKCNTKCDDNATFCSKCGNSLTTEGVSLTDTVQPVADATQSETDVQQVNQPQQVKPLAKAGLLWRRIRRIGSAALVIFVFLGALSTIFGWGWFNFNFNSRANDADVQTVRAGHFDFAPSTSIGTAFDRFFGNPTWEQFTATSGERIVNFTGNFLWENRDTQAVIQFVVTGARFEIRAVEFNGEPQNVLVQNILMAAVFDDVGAGGTSSTGSNDPISATFGSTFTYLGFEFVIGHGWDLVHGIFEVPVTITNISGVENMIGAGTRTWSPDGLSINGWLEERAGWMRPGATVNASFNFADSGDGVYEIYLHEMLVSLDPDVIITLEIDRGSTNQQPPTGQGATGGSSLESQILGNWWTDDDFWPTRYTFNADGTGDWDNSSFSWWIDGSYIHFDWGDFVWVNGIEILGDVVHLHWWDGPVTGTTILSRR